MKKLVCGFVMSLGILTSEVAADQLLKIDGEDYLLSTLLETCQELSDDPVAQIACVSAVSQLLEEQTSGEQEDHEIVTEALADLRALAQYQDDGSGLSIAGSGCNIHIVYYNNYFHISRRNISEIDLFSAKFDASSFQFDKTVEVPGAQAPLVTGFMAPGAKAEIRGGLVLESSQHNFAPRSPRATIDAYANEVVGQLSAKESQTFDFVLIHPQRSQASAEIWSAFETFVDACGQLPPSWSLTTLGNS
jgi:hypothetical protein